MSTKVEFKYSELFKQAVIDSFKKLHPRDEIKNLVMFVVYIGSIWTTIILFLPGRSISWSARRYCVCSRTAKKSTCPVPT